MAGWGACVGSVRNPLYPRHPFNNWCKQNKPQLVHTALQHYFHPKRKYWHWLLKIKHQWGCDGLLVAWKVLHSTLPPNLKYEAHKYNIHPLPVKVRDLVLKIVIQHNLQHLSRCSVDDGVSEGQFVDVPRVSSSDNGGDGDAPAHHGLHHVQISPIQPWEILTVIHKQSRDNLQGETLGCQSYPSPWSVRRSLPSSSSQWGSTPASYRTTSGRKISSTLGRWASTVDHQTRTVNILMATMCVIYYVMGHIVF